MAIVTGDRYLESLVKFVENQAEKLIEGTVVLKLNPVGLRYVQSRLEALTELESLLSGAPVDYLRAYVSDLGDHRALEQLRRILRLLPSLKIVSVLPPLTRDPTPLCLLPFGRLKVLELRGCNLSLAAAKGMLELRFTLEKLICHNSTDALRHVFTGRIMEINDSPQWNRLSFVSCACNDLVLMDESLMLLSAVETLDLSRNKFAKVDNLRACNKLKHLDLGFNNLRSISSFSEVSCQIVRLVLRNNALTSLHGIENLKSLKDLDISNNIISKFTEVEILAGLPSLQNLWMEGNPICFARWFRAQVFSLFTPPDMLTLDDKRISKREFWKRQIIVASRQGRPASFGFYSPAKEDADLEEGTVTRKKRISRLVSIENEAQSTCILSDQDSLSSNNDTLGKDENDITEDVAEVENLMQRIEFMKKERSVLWLQEFEEWMNHASENITDAPKVRGNISSYCKKTHSNITIKDEDHRDTARYIPNSGQLSGDESCTIILESDTSFADTSTTASVQAQQFVDPIGDSGSRFFMGHVGGDRFDVKTLTVNHGRLRSISNEERMPVDSSVSHLNLLAIPQWDHQSAKKVISPSPAINDITGSHILLASPGSPPQYKQDILHRRHNKEEEFLLLSADSFSVAFSDSNTSCSDDDSVEPDQPSTQANQSHTVNIFETSEKGFSTNSRGSEAYNNEMPSHRQNGTHMSGPCAEGQAVDPEDQELDISNHASSSSMTSEITVFSENGTDWFEKKRHKRKPRIMISLAEEDVCHGDTESSKMFNKKMEICRIGNKSKEKEISRASVFGNLFQLEVPEMAQTPV